METRSYFQSAVAECTNSTILLGVRSRPEGHLRTSSHPWSFNLTCVPPTSITRIAMTSRCPCRSQSSSSPSPAPPRRVSSCERGRRVKKPLSFRTGGISRGNVPRVVRRDRFPSGTALLRIHIRRERSTRRRSSLLPSLLGVHPRREAPLRRIHAGGKTVGGHTRDLLAVVGFVLLLGLFLLFLDLLGDFVADFLHDR